MKRIVAAAFGMVVLVVWGMLFWGLLAESFGVFHKLPNDVAVTEVLNNGGALTGTYFMPWPRTTAVEFAAFEAQHKVGPFYRLSYVKEGIDPSSPRKLLIGCLHYLSVAGLATCADKPLANARILWSSEEGSRSLMCANSAMRSSLSRLSARSSAPLRFAPSPE